MNEQPDSEAEHRTDEGLRRLLGTAFPDAAPAERPDDEAMEAWLDGTPDEEQRRLMEDALFRSEEFVDEMRDRAQGRADVGDPELAARMAAVVMPGTPSGKRQRAPILRLLWRPEAAYALAAVLVGLILMPQLTRIGPAPSGPVLAVVMEQSDAQRGNDPALDRPLALPTEAGWVDLTVRKRFNLEADLGFRVELKRRDDDSVVLTREKVSGFLVADEPGFGYPTVRVASSELAPGRYELTVLPVAADGRALNHALARGLFTVSEPDGVAP